MHPPLEISRFFSEPLYISYNITILFLLSHLFFTHSCVWIASPHTYLCKRLFPFSLCTLFINFYTAVYDPQFSSLHQLLHYMHKYYRRRFAFLVSCYSIHDSTSWNLLSLPSTWISLCVMSNVSSRDHSQLFSTSVLPFLISALFYFSRILSLEPIGLSRFMRF